MEKDKELVQVILDGNAQSVLDVYTSKTYGWVKRCNSLYSSSIVAVVEKLNLGESDAAIVICSTLESALKDIKEHREYSEEYDNEEEINQMITQFKNKIQTINNYKWEYLYQLCGIIKNGHFCFAMTAAKEMKDPLQAGFIKKISAATRNELPDVIMNTKDFSFMSPLLDEAVLSVLSKYIKDPSSDQERIEIKKYFEAFDYYANNRPLPLCFGTKIIGDLIEIAARLKDQEFAEKITPYIDKITPNVAIYISLSRFYSVFKNRDKLIESMKLSAEYGADEGDFSFFRTEDNPWQQDGEVQSLIPLSFIY